MMSILEVVPETPHASGLTQAAEESSKQQSGNSNP
jgi:hypothetical protein